MDITWALKQLKPHEIKKRELVSGIRRAYQYNQARELSSPIVLFTPPMLHFKLNMMILPIAQ